MTYKQELIAELLSHYGNYDDIRRELEESTIDAIKSHLEDIYRRYYMGEEDYLS